MFEHSAIEKKALQLEIKKIEAAICANQDMISNSTFESGFLGPSLFYSYLWLYTGNKDYLLRSELFLEKALSLFNVSKFERLYKTDSIDNHISQVARFFEFVKTNNIMNVDSGEIVESFDPIMFNLMNSKISIGDFDIQSGALAAGYFYLSRTTNKDHTADALSVLIKGLEAKAKIDERGNYSWSAPALYNRRYLGISHGSALVISFVCNVFERGIERQLCTRLLTRASAFLTGFKSDFGKGLFPNYAEDTDKGPKQFSLCYGDIGIGYALLRMAKLLNNEHAYKTATEILADCTTRRKEDNLTLDASLIYGASGLAATFEKIYTITKAPVYLKSAGYWYSKIPEYARHSNQFAGYKSRISQEENGIWDVNFGWGLAGIGTSLLKYLKPELPSLAPLLLIA